MTTGRRNRANAREKITTTNIPLCVALEYTGSTLFFLLEMVMFVRDLSFLFVLLFTTQAQSQEGQLNFHLLREITISHPVAHHVVYVTSRDKGTTVGVEWIARPGGYAAVLSHKSNVRC